MRCWSFISWPSRLVSWLCWLWGVICRLSWLVSWFCRLWGVICRLSWCWRIVCWLGWRIVGRLSWCFWFVRLLWWVIYWSFCARSCIDRIWRINRNRPWCRRCWNIDWVAVSLVGLLWWVCGVAWLGLGSVVAWFSWLRLRLVIAWFRCCVTSLLCRGRIAWLGSWWCIAWLRWCFIRILDFRSFDWTITWFGW